MAIEETRLGEVRMISWVLPQKSHTTCTFVLARVGLITGLLILILSLPSTGADKEKIAVQWKRPIKQPVCLAMSHGGRYFGSVDKEGAVQFYDSNGKPLWKQRVEGATDVMIARGGQSLLVYSKLNPVYQEVRFFRSNGDLLWKHKVEGCVWSGAVSPDGRYAAVTTGERYIYLYMPDPKRPRFRRWRLDGIGHDVTFTPDNKRLIIGTWQESGLVCYDTEGKFQWRVRHDTEQQYNLQISGDGKTILGIIPGKQNDPHLDIRLWDSGGKSVWDGTIDGFDGRALVSPSSRYVAIGYANYLKAGKSDMLERKIAVYRTNGRLSWEKGGLFFSPRLVALSPKGSSVIVWDGEKSLYNIDRNGRILSRMTLGGKVRDTLASEDGKRILLYCGDGWLYLMRVI